MNKNLVIAMIMGITTPAIAGGAKPSVEQFVGSYVGTDYSNTDDCRVDVELSKTFWGYKKLTVTITVGDQEPVSFADYLATFDKETHYDGSDSLMTTSFSHNRTTGLWSSDSDTFYWGGHDGDSLQFALIQKFSSSGPFGNKLIADASCHNLSKETETSEQ